MDKNNRQYTNGEITVFWKPTLCTHSTICFMRLPEVFKPGARPWIDMEGADTQTIIKIVKACPSGALEFEWNNQDKKEEPKEENKTAIEIKFSENEPYMITGNFKLKDAEGNIIAEKNKAALCSCGRSKRKPFCDGSHRDI